MVLMEFEVCNVHAWKTTVVHENSGKFLEVLMT